MQRGSNPQPASSYPQPLSQASLNDQNDQFG